MPGFEIFGEEEKREIQDVLDSGVLFRYEFAEQRKGVYKVKEFEEKFARYCGTGYAQAVTSGTSALKVGLAALGVGPGDEVITQGFTFVATWEAILELGAVPIFTEIDATLNMDPNDLKKKITPKTRCIVPVHMLGAQARIREIVEIADAHSLPVLEDTAQSAGGRIAGRHLGTFGKCGTFSFDSVKTMTTGEGGMVITADEDLWRTMSEYQDHGHDHAPNPGGRGGEGRRFIGSNYRMMEIQGAIGIAQLAKLDMILAGQRANKSFLKEAVSAIPGVSFRELVDAEGDTATHLSFFLQDSGTLPEGQRGLAGKRLRGHQLCGKRLALLSPLGASPERQYPGRLRLAICRTGRQAKSDLRSRGPAGISRDDAAESGVSGVDQDV